jgi:hypothetical protein
VLACFNASAKVADRVTRKENTRQKENQPVTNNAARWAALSQMANHWPPEITDPFFHAKVHARTVGEVKSGGGRAW